MYRVICVILSVLLFLTPFSVNPHEVGDTVTAYQSRNISFEAGERKFISFAKNDINTVEISFQKAEEITIDIYNGDTLIYSRRGCEQYRFCAFNTIYTDSLTIVTDKPCTITDITISLKTSTNKDFRVTAYAVASGLNESNVTYNSFEVITDVILFGCVTFDESGNLTANEELISSSLALLRERMAENKVNIYLNILGPDADGGIDDWNEQMYNKADKHTKAFKNSALISSAVALVEKYNFDGVFFDYEYPIRLADWSAFNSFLGKLDKATDKKIGIAVSCWNFSANFGSFRHVDMIELMQYDLFDDRGNHSSFATATEGVELCEKYYVPFAKSDLGLPFYGRPADRGGYWPTYNEYAEALGNSDGCDTGSGYSYFNCRQTVYDKTAYAIDAGLGGVMVWHYSCDITDISSSLSLFGAMNECINDRIK